MLVVDDEVGCFYGLEGNGGDEVDEQVEQYFFVDQQGDVQCVEGWWQVVGDDWVGEQCQ